LLYIYPGAGSGGEDKVIKLALSTHKPLSLPPSFPPSLSLYTHRWWEWRRKRFMSDNHMSNMHARVC
jgi:hypothetical protein